MATARDYKAEYKAFHGKPAQIANRAQRNQARSVLESAGRVAKGDGREVDHKTPISKGGSNAKHNLRVVSRATNRSKGSK